MQAREARRAEKEASQAGKAVAVQPSSVVERSEAEEIKSPTGVSDVVSAPQGALAAAKKTSLALAALRNRTQAAPERSSFLNAIKDLRKTDANDAEEAQPMSATVEAGPKPEVSGAGRPEMGGLLGGIRSFNRGGLKPVEKKPEEAKSADPVPSAPKATPKGMSTSASNKPQASAGNGKSLAEALEARKKVLDASEKAAKDSAPNATPKITFGDTLKKAVKPSQPAAVDQSITQAAEPARRSTNLFEAFSDDSGFSPLVITVPVDKKLMSASGRKSPTSVADDVSASSADVS
ncbi:MAG: hypothetical protein QG632_683, partial [Candidatus Dependentiae bacterium]|nr:hypothetical protein [Candidatus Dependentiae bacterium]